MILRAGSASSVVGREKTTVSRGDILEVDLEPVQGSEMAKTRPCLIVSNNIANRSSPLVTVVAVTSQAPKKNYPFIVEVPTSANMPEKSWINTAHMRTIDKRRLTGRYFTSLDKATMQKVDGAIKKQLALT